MTGRHARALPSGLVDELDALLPGRVTRDQLVGDLTTYRLGGPIAAVVRAASPDDLAAVAGALAVADRDDVETLVVGRGSNLLVADTGFAGVGIVLQGTFEEIVVDASAATVRAGGAVPLPVLARRAAAAGVGGLEFFVGIPGSVGGAVRMNAGGHGAETGDVLVAASVCPLRGPGAGSVEHREPETLELGYRRSAIGPSDVVTGAGEGRGAPDDPAACTERIDEVVRWRREHQPGGANAGSVFRNPPGDSAGRLIDDAGCKELRVGGAFVSPKHANFFQADDDATAGDVHRLVREVQRRVADHAGVCLQPELHMIGFEPGEPVAGEAAR